MRRRWAVVAVIALAACSTLSASGPVVAVDPGLQPRMSPAQVAAIVLERIDAMEEIAHRVVAVPRIIRMTLTRADQVTRVEPRAGQGPSDMSGVWVVWAAGTFVTQHGRAVVGPFQTAASGSFVISDADGSIVSFGFP
jgi:hypothetical protein